MPAASIVSPLHVQSPVRLGTFEPLRNPDPSPRITIEEPVEYAEYGPSAGQRENFWRKIRRQSESMRYIHEGEEQKVIAPDTLAEASAR